MSRIRLTWDIGLFNPEKHYIYRSDSEISPNNLPSPIAEVGQGVNEYVDDDGIVEDETYHYFVAAEKKGLLVPAEASVTVIAIPFINDPFFDGSEISFYPLISREMYLENEDDILLEVGFREEEGFSIPISPVEDGSYSNRINTTLSSPATGFSFWYKTYGLTGETNQFLLDPRLVSGSGWLTVTSSGNDDISSVSKYVVDGNTDNNLIAAYDGDWHHIYVEFNSTVQSLTIGSRHASTSYNPSGNGLFRYFRAFNRSLSDSEINEIIQMDSPL